MAKTPALYIGHGAPLLLDDPIWSGELARWANELEKPKGILIITRGGLIPGGMLASLSHIKNIRVVVLESYEKMKRGALRLIHKPNIPNKGAGWLVIDDIVDTGATTKFVQKLFPKAHYLSLVVKPQGEHLVHDYSYKVSQDTWVVFPWEVAE